MYINRSSFLRSFFFRNTSDTVLMLLSEKPVKGMTISDLDKICVVSADLRQRLSTASGTEQMELYVWEQSNYPGLLRSMTIDGKRLYAHTPTRVITDNGTSMLESTKNRTNATVQGNLYSQMSSCTFSFGKEMTFTHCNISSVGGTSARIQILNNGATILNNGQRGVTYTFAKPETAQELSMVLTSTSLTYDLGSGFYFFTEETTQPLPAITHAVIAKTLNTSKHPVYFEIDLADIKMDAVPTDGYSKSLNIESVRVSI